MIIYEKENKLNINFDNSTEAEPDVAISKEDGQVNIEAGGQPIGGGGSEQFVVTFSGTTEGGNAECDKTLAEVVDAFASGKQVLFRYGDYDDYFDNTVGEGFAVYQTDGDRYQMYACTITGWNSRDEIPMFIEIQWSFNNPSTPSIYRVLLK